MSNSSEPSERTALDRVREWVEQEVDDWFGPVIEPQLHDDLREVVGLPPRARPPEPTA